MDQTQIFQQIVITLGVTTGTGLLAFSLRQPLMVPFIGVGLLVGPAGLGLVEDTALVELFGRMGVALLLFIVGLRLDLGVIRTFGRVAFLSGAGQVAFTALIGLAPFSHWALGLCSPSTSLSRSLSPALSWS